MVITKLLKLRLDSADCWIARLNRRGGAGVVGIVVRIRVVIVLVIAGIPVVGIAIWVAVVIPGIRAVIIVAERIVPRIEPDPVPAIPPPPMATRVMKAMLVPITMPGAIMTTKVAVIRD